MSAFFDLDSLVRLSQKYPMAFNPDWYNNKQLAKIDSQESADDKN